jgi:D-2-hydroxyacid dehydrogenase (NADP+)
MADHVLRDGPNIRWIQALTTGTDGIDDLPSLRKDVLLTSMHGTHGRPVSEAALCGMFVLSRHVPAAVRHQKQKIWERQPARLLDGKTVGIFGVGAIGQALAPKCKGLGMTVIGIDPLTGAAAGVDRMVTWDMRAEVLPQLDFVVSLVPSIPQTKDMFDADFFSQAKQGAYFVNVGRGATVNDEALLAALRSGKIAGAALDVFKIEPLPPDHPYWSMENVFITAHNAGLHDESERSKLPILCENIRRYLAGDTNLINLVKH